MRDEFCYNEDMYWCATLMLFLKYRISSPKFWSEGPITGGPKNMLVKTQGF